MIFADYLLHYGRSKLDGAPGRGSGRYPLGSGDNPNQRHSAGDFRALVNRMRKDGIPDAEIAKSLGLKNTTELRIQLSLAVSEERAPLVATAKELKERGYSTSEIARRMGKNESTIRSYLNEDSERRMNEAKNTAEYLKEVIKEKGIIDIGGGVEQDLGVSRERLEEALYLLELDGYPRYKINQEQLTNAGRYTRMYVVGPPGTEYKDIYEPGIIKSVRDYEGELRLTDGGSAIRKRFEYPASMDSSRIKVVYDEDGGSLKDGLVEIRRGVDDLSLGDAHYAQIRVLVDGTHYVKGMAVYRDDLPDGVDMIFNTNKHRGTPLLGEGKNSVLKEIDKKDPNNPFGSLIKENGGQSYYDDPKGKYVDPVTGKRQSLSLINKRAEEGDWGEWADRLPSQFLSKQPEKLIKQQLKLALDNKRGELDTINECTNPTVKKQLLISFAEDCDSAAVHLQAAALPRQKYQVIIPVKSMKDNEIYAPGYRDGETVYLVRYPHGGIFEIPVLKVNNNQKEAIKMMGGTRATKDMVGINKKVADQLSGADFDGDTVMVIPAGSQKISAKSGLKELKGFDPKLEYGGKKEGTFKVLSKGATQNEMGKISNLITDMTLLGATDAELARAIRHSMVVIDANKHKLDYKQSEKDNGIRELKKKYQGDGGVATLISRAKSPTTQPKSKGSPKINAKGKDYYDPNKPEGSLIFQPDKDRFYEETRRIKVKDERGRIVRNSDGSPMYRTETYTDPKTGKVHQKYLKEKTGKIKERTRPSTRMADTDDAYTLLSDARTKAEIAYADYANSLKAMANQARKDSMSTRKLSYDPHAAKVYANEVKELEAGVRKAESNRPRERRAQAIAAAKVDAIRADNPDMSASEVSKYKQRYLQEARDLTGASRRESSIKLTDRQVEAIQAGAISSNKLEKILRSSDMDVVKQQFMPRKSSELSEPQQARIKALSSMGYTQEQIANSLGVSTSTIAKYQ